MIRLTKVKKLASKKGFTLLEVILSVAIMLILTTMMMNGFAATMSYSYHTSVYASTAASNYSSALSKLAAKSKAGMDSAYADMGKDSTKTGVISIARTNAGYNNPSAYKNLKIEVYRENGGAESAKTHGYRSQVEDYGDTADGTYSNNRSSFFYYPNYITTSTTSTDRGALRVYKYSDGYWWCRKTVGTGGAVTVTKVAKVSSAVVDTQTTTEEGA